MSWKVSTSAMEQSFTKKRFWYKIQMGIYLDFLRLKIQMINSKIYHFYKHEDYLYFMKEQQSKIYGGGFIVLHGIYTYDSFVF